MPLPLGYTHHRSLEQIYDLSFNPPLTFPHSARSPVGHQGHLRGRAHHPRLVAGSPRHQRQDRHVLCLHEDHGEREAVHAKVRGLPAAQPLLRPGPQPEPTLQGRPVDPFRLLEFNVGSLLLRPNSFQSLSKVTLTLPVRKSSNQNESGGPVQLLGDGEHGEGARAGVADRDGDAAEPRARRRRQLLSKDHPRRQGGGPAGVHGRRRSEAGHRVEVQVSSELYLTI